MAVGPMMQGEQRNKI